MTRCAESRWAATADSSPSQAMVPPSTSIAVANGLTGE